MAKKAVSPSNDKPISKGQAGKFADLFVAALVKSDLPSEPTQLVLERRGAALSEKFLALVRDEVDALSKIIRRTVPVNRALSPEAAIAATGRRQFVAADAVATMPRGEGNVVTITFILLEKWMSDEVVDKLLSEHGLFAVDPFALAAYNATEPDFATKRPCFTHWRDDGGNWCCAAWDCGRSVDVGRYSRGWYGGWWAAGVRK